MIQRCFDACGSGSLNLGMQYDHNATEITFTGFQKLKADSTIYIIMEKPVEAMVPLTDDFKFVVQQYCTEEVGSFRAQLVEYRIEDGTTDVMELVHASPRFYCTVAQSLEPQDPPEVTDPTLDLVYAQMHQAYLEMLAHEETASAAAQLAVEKAAAAALSESNAEAWAVGERGGEPVPTTDETYQNNSKYYADLAKQKADDAGFVMFEIDNSTGDVYVEVSDHLNEDLTFAINNETGDLEVIFA